MVYDPDARRETPLAQKLKSQIERTGPITVRDYMRMCLDDPEHGYYRTQAGIGRAGDFLTAPEISQVFGELIGLWAAVVWQQMRQPAAFNLVEIGPGRGTLIADAIRATRHVPGFHTAATVTLVEPNPALASEQRKRLAGVPLPIQWANGAEEIVPAVPAPSIMLANEVLDCLPVTQFVRADLGWCERGVGLDESGRLVFCELGRRPIAFAGDADRGAILEQRDTTEIGHLLTRFAGPGPLAALFIDYGYDVASVGETLQSVRGHAFEHPLTSPGEADLTAHVDFSSFGCGMSGLGFDLDGPVMQAEFLGALGISERGSRLMAANPSRAGEIETALLRLMSPTGMGGRFKAIGVRTPGLPALPGLSRVDNCRAAS